MDRNYRILIVDDEPGIRDEYAGFFRERGYDVETANDGGEGYQMALDGEFDVAIVDIRMPRMNGIQMIAKLIEAGVDTSFIIVTGHGERSEAVNALNLGVSYWFDKSEIDLNKLKAKTLELAEGLPADVVQRILSAIPDEG